jgi:hypothetical protein
VGKNGAASSASLTATAWRWPTANGHLRPRPDQRARARCSRGGSEPEREGQGDGEGARKTVGGAQARRYRRGGAARKTRLSRTVCEQGKRRSVRRRRGGGGASCTGNRTEAVYRCRNKAEVAVVRGGERRSAVDGAGGRKRGSERGGNGRETQRSAVLKLDAGAGFTVATRRVAGMRPPRGGRVLPRRTRSAGRAGREGGGRADAGRAACVARARARLAGPGGFASGLGSEAAAC